MTILELQDILAQRIKLAGDTELDPDTRKMEAEYSATISSLAKQFINAADITLRGEKLIADGKLSKGSVTAKVVGVNER